MCAQGSHSLIEYRTVRLTGHNPVTCNIILLGIYFILNKKDFFCILYNEVMTYFGKESENENHQMWASFTTALN